jgi:hypothetical protein
VREGASLNCPFLLGYDRFIMMSLPHPYSDSPADNKQEEEGDACEEGWFLEEGLCVGIGGDFARVGGDGGDCTGLVCGEVRSRKKHALV